MKWLDDMKASAAAFKGWARLMAILAAAAVAILAVIAVELLVICVRV